MKTSCVYGVHAVTSLLKERAESVQALLVQEGARQQKLETLLSKAKQRKIPIRLCARAELAERAGSERHQGIVALVAETHHKPKQSLEDCIQAADVPLVLVLDQVQDPHNLGACLRTAEAMGVTAVVVPEHQSAGLTPVVRKVASGAAERIPFYVVKNLAQSLKNLQTMGLWIVGAAGEANETLESVDLKGPTAIIMGSEGKGMRRLTREHCDFLVRIPMQGEVGSFNVSVATGIMLYEAVRQRKG